ncbi:MAG: SLC13 family permease [Treponema sp.]|nr:SLC13 family permease [Treponema sp.]
MSPLIIGGIILGATVICFFHPKIPNVPVAIAAGFAFVLTGILPAPTVFNSFTSNTIILMIGMMTIGGAMFTTGLAGWIGKKLMGLTGTKKGQIQLAIFLTTAILAPFVTGTATLMIMYPLICSIAISTKTSMSDIVAFQMWGSSTGSAFTFTGMGMIGTTAAILEANGYRIWNFFEIAYYGLPSKLITVVLIYFFANKFLLKGYKFKEPDAAAAAGTKDLPEKFTFKMGVVAFILVGTLLGFVINNPAFPPHVGAVLGGLACLFTGTLTPKQMYTSISWDVVMLIGGMSAFARGFEASGMSRVIADSIMFLTGANPSPILMIFIILITTSLISQFMSDNGAAALMAPIAITLAVAQGVNVHAYVFAALAGSFLCHLSIMASPSMAFTQQLGGYDNKYFLKYGGVFELVPNLIAAMIIIPLIYL